MPPALDHISEYILAVGALGTAAFGLVDGSKAFRGGISRAGFRYIRAALEPFDSALTKALGKDIPDCDWRAVMRSHWINGRPKDEQKAIAVALIQLGLAPETVDDVAKGGNVDVAELKKVVDKLAKGGTLDEQQLNLVGRLKATIEARTDAAYERADQVYRSYARFWAGVLAILLAFVADYLLLTGQGVAVTDYFGPTGGHPAEAFFVGLVAVPLAPIAKDVASALSKAVHALGRRAG
jgi:hypothetical protein